MNEEKTGSVNDEKQIQDKKDGGINLGRHQAQCTICLSPYRQQIEEEWINWRSPGDLEERFKISRYTLYRHAHAQNLFPKRRENVLMALEKIIERVDWTETRCSDVLSAIKLLIKLNGAGQGGKPVEETVPKKVVQPMTPEERQEPVQDGSLPEPPSEANAITPCQSQEGETTSPVTESKQLQ